MSYRNGNVSAKAISYITLAGKPTTGASCFNTLIDDRVLPLDNDFFGCDFTLFDDLELENSLLYNPDTSIAAIDEAGFLDFGLTNTPSTIDYSPTTTTQLFTPSGSEEPFSDHELTPALSEPSLSRAGFTDSPTINSPLTPTSTRFPPLDITHKFPPLDAPKPASRKRKATTVDRDLDSPRPKELVPITIDDDDDDRDIKRKRNTAAARRYRQKKQDRMKELEEELEAMKAERDQWKEEAARQKMEADKYREMFQLLKK